MVLTALFISAGFLISAHFILLTSTSANLTKKLFGKNVSKVVIFLLGILIFKVTLINYQHKVSYKYLEYDKKNYLIEHHKRHHLDRMM